MRISDWSSDVCSSDLLVLLLADAEAELADPRILADVGGRDDDLVRLALQDGAQRLAREPGDFPLKRPDAGLAGVIADQVAQPGVGPRDLSLPHPIRLDLLLDAVALCDPHLFVFVSIYLPAGLQQQ